MMTGNDIFCPAGTPNPTESTAVVKITKTEQASKTPKVGEVWTDTRVGKTRLVLAARPFISTCLTLAEVAHDGNIAVTVEGVEMHTEPGMIYMFNPKDYGEKVATLLPEELATVKAAVAKALGLDVSQKPDLESKYSGALEALKEKDQIIKRLHDDLYKMENEMDTVPYKALYDELIEKLIAAKVVTL